jgi:ubiquinone/menaquinone biosynthesis C-methylase UbiE
MEAFQFGKLQTAGYGTGMEGMDDSSLGKLRVWHDAPAPAPDSVDGHTASPIFGGPHNPAHFAERLYAWETLRASSAKESIGDGLEPYTLQWFLNIEIQRHRRQGRWIPRLLEFAKHSGETLVGLGNGLGTDWLQYARHGASVIVCSPSREQLALIRRNFELRGLSGRFLHAPATALPLETASVDVACVSGLLHEVSQPEAVVGEVYRVLKPGGKVLAVTAAKYDIAFWLRLCFPWEAWLRHARARRQRGLRFSARGLRRLFGRFVDHRVHKRHIARSDVPHLWRLIPRAVLERFMGRALVLKAFKPLSAAIAAQAAA